jgi:hypothetical protein
MRPERRFAAARVPRIVDARRMRLRRLSATSIGLACVAIAVIAVAPARSHATTAHLAHATAHPAAHPTAHARTAKLPDRPIVAATELLIRDSLASLSTRSGPADQQYFANGVWHSSAGGCWYCMVGPGTAAAVLWRTTGEHNHHLKALAVKTFDAAIAQHHNANGSFGDPANSPGIASMMFGVELGTSYLELKGKLGRRRRTLWRKAITGIANFLIRTGNLTWYTNGNINIGYVEMYYLAWRASGERRFKRAYNAAWRFTLHPPQGRWPGFGLHLIAGDAVAASGAHLSGPAGYLSESEGAGAPGFDPEYTELQLDVDTRLYVLSHDPRALRLARELVNALLPRVNSSWYLNTSGGSRHPQQGRTIAFLSPALVVLGWLDHRSELARLATGEFRVIDQIYGQTDTSPNVNLYRGWGNDISVILQAAAVAAPKLVRSDYARLRVSAS